VPNHSTKNPAFVLLTMGAVAGMFGLAGLPAYAFQEGSQTVDYASDSTQSLTVSAEAASSLLARDAFTATTPEELQAQRDAAAAAAAASAASQARSAISITAATGRAAGDDYPFYGMGGMSPLNYYAGECVDFVAWRLNRDIGSTSAPFRWVWSNLTPGGGSATSWTSQWYAAGRTVSNVPVPGAVAVTDYYHVAYVNSVNADGTVFLEEYNYAAHHTYGTRTVPASSVIAYLYPPGY